MATPEVLIISLRTATARRELQTAQCNRLGLPFRFLDATTVADIPLPELARLERAWCRPLRQTEVACALSHRRAWAEVVDGDAPLLILEDDAVLADETPAVISALAGRTDLECVTLETFAARKVLGTSQPLGVAPFRLSEVYRDSAGAAAHLLWPQGAHKLLRGRHGFLPLADAAFNLAPGLRMHQVEPACAIQAMFLREDGGFTADTYQSSASGVSRPPIPGLADWIRYKSRRLRVSLILFARQLRGFGRSTKRTVAFRRISS